MDLKHMGRDTIAGLIAGILQKYSKKEEVKYTTQYTPVFAVMCFLVFSCILNEFSVKGM